MDKKSKLIIALPKGRIAIPAYYFFAKINNGFRNRQFETGKLDRNLSFESELATFWLPKSGDVPMAVDSGYADIGIAGFDSIREYELGNIDRTGSMAGRGFDSGYFDDLSETHADFPKTKFAVIGDRGQKTKYENTVLRTIPIIGTKYANITREYFVKSGITPDIMKMNGSCEIAIKFLNADAIFDLVETGTTLKANGLEIYKDALPNPVKLLINTVARRKDPRLSKENLTEITSF
jgi:ATP phosphoribosyltransferase